MMKTKRYFYLINGVVMLLLLTIGISIAYLATDGFKDHSRVIGNVDVSSSIYHDTIATPAKLVEIIDTNTNTTYTKPGIYEMNVSDPNDPYFIDKLRVSFYVGSNVETYIRVKFIISEILTYRNNNGELVEIATNIDDIVFSLHPDWYYDDINQYYYIKNTVIKSGTGNTLIDFVMPGLQYTPKSPQYTVQIQMRYEAVQAHLGPQKNWGLNTPPWGGNW